MAKHKRWVSFSVFLFVFSLTQQAFYVNDPNVWKDRAYFLLLVGWVGLGEGVLAWLANPLLFLTWILVLTRRNRVACVTSIAAAIAAGSFVFVRELPANEASTLVRVTGYGLGYWLWIASIVAAGVSAFKYPLKSDKLKP